MVFPEVETLQIDDFFGIYPNCSCFFIPGTHLNLNVGGCRYIYIWLSPPPGKCMTVTEQSWVYENTLNFQRFIAFCFWSNFYMSPNGRNVLKLLYKFVTKYWGLKRRCDLIAICIQVYQFKSVLYTNFYNILWSCFGLAVFKLRIFDILQGWHWSSIFRNTSECFKCYALIFYEL